MLVADRVRPTQVSPAHVENLHLPGSAAVATVSANMNPWLGRLFEVCVRAVAWKDSVVKSTIVKPFMPISVLGFNLGGSCRERYRHSALMAITKFGAKLVTICEA